MTQPKHKPVKATALAKLEQSQLSPQAAKGLQGIQDVDIESLIVSVRGATSVEIADAIEDIDIELTIEGASTITVSIDDPNNKVLKSGLLVRTADINIDDLWFRLAAIKKPSRGKLDLVFEDREVRVLRTHDKKLGPISRTKITRAEFIKRMADEAKEVKIQTYIPQIHNVQTIETTTDTLSWSGAADAQQQGINRRAGFRPSADTSASADAFHHRESLGLTIKGDPADTIQIKNINTILATGVSQGARRKVLVCSIMTTIQEASARNLAGGDLDSVGCFQQRKSQGWPASRDVARDAAEFFNRAIGLDRTSPGLPYWQVCADVQRPREDLRMRYNDWRTEAERFVNAYGVPGTDFEETAAGTTDYGNLSGGTDYFYYRGVPPTGGSGAWKKENSWDCSQRLASEVQWRSFMRAGVWWFITEDFLFKSKSVASINEDSEGVIEITFDFDEGKLVGQVTVSAFLKRWAAPPGTILTLTDLGPVDGRWLVTSVRRSAYSEQGEITLKKPLPKLLEPAQGNLQQSAPWASPADPTTDANFRVGTALIKPIPKGALTSIGGPHNTLNLPGFPAFDYFAKAGTPVLAVESGTIQRFTGHDPLLGPIEGAGGPLGWSIYLKGESGAIYYYTHLGKRLTYEGAHVFVGDVIATVADYKSYGRDDHVHLGVEPPASGFPNTNTVHDAALAVKG